MHYYKLVAPILFRIEPERAHALGMSFMRLVPAVNIDEASLHVKTKFGVLRNPIGLAAGFDKTGEHLSAIERLGFGYLIAGTVTLDPWPGHPKPRIVRYPKDKTMVNALGFPNPGVDVFIENLKRQKVKVPVLGSVSGRELESIVKCYDKLQPNVAGIELNLSSPNTSKLKDFRKPDSFKELAQSMRPLKRKPTYLKIPPYVDETQFLEVLELVKFWEQLGFDGVTAANAIPVDEPRVSIKTGGFSGPPLFPNLIKAIKIIRQNVPKDFEVNAIGGISSAENIRTAMSEGANTVQILTALVFEGPGLIKQILNDLKKHPGN